MQNAKWQRRGQRMFCMKEMENVKWKNRGLLHLIPARKPSHRNSQKAMAVKFYILHFAFHIKKGPKAFFLVLHHHKLLGLYLRSVSDLHYIHPFGPGLGLYSYRLASRIGVFIHQSTGLAVHIYF